MNQFTQTALLRDSMAWIVIFHKMNGIYVTSHFTRTSGEAIDDTIFLYQESSFLLQIN